MPAIYIREDSELPERREFDFYPTDRLSVVNALGMACRGCFIPSRVLDPGAGAGIWGQIARRRWPCCQITGVELRDVQPHKSYDEWLNGSFLDDTVPLLPPYDLVMGNPPYSDAEAFVRRSLDLLRDGGRLVFLLKLSFMAGQRRSSGLYSEFPPRWYIPCSRRPSFTGDGHSAPEEYAIYVWQKGFSGREKVLRVPASTHGRNSKRPPVYMNAADKRTAERHRQRTRIYVP